MYRLVTKNTYEEQLFQAASRKYGLDEAILGDNMGEQRDPEQNKEIENLLLKGAYHCLQVGTHSQSVYHTEAPIAVATQPASIWRFVQVEAAGRTWAH